jgi:hypothetical protein
MMHSMPGAMYDIAPLRLDNEPVALTPDIELPWGKRLHGSRRG